jgi:hypothetical protein
MGRVGVVTVSVFGRTIYGTAPTGIDFSVYRSHFFRITTKCFHVEYGAVSIRTGTSIAFWLSNVSEDETVRLRPSFSLLGDLFREKPHGMETDWKAKSKVHKRYLEIVLSSVELTFG